MSKFQVRMYADSDIGVRDDNEDTHILNKLRIDEKKGIYISGIFDGHGGKEVSNILKKYFPHVLVMDKSRLLSGTYLKDCFENVHKIIDKKYSKEGYGSGSTALVCILDNETILIGSAGDCRAVICHGDKAVQLNKEHRPNEPKERARIEKLGGKIEFDGDDYRIGALNVSRGFGDFDTTPYVSHEPDITKFNMTSKDRFVILACDGVWDVVDNQEAVNFVLKEIKKGTKASEIPRKLIDYSIKVKKSEDNVTVIIAFIVHN